MRPRRHLTSALVVAAAFVLAPATAGAQPDAELPPGLGIRQLDLPMLREDDGRSARYVTDHVEPGAVIQRRIELGNGTDAPMTVQLYAADASVEDGWVVADGRGTSEVSGWILVDPPEVTIAPGERVTASFRIDVPEDAAGGERYAAIIAEAPPVGDTVAVVPRVGVRVYLSVGGPEAPPTDFLIDELTPGRDAAGAPLVMIGVDNTGGRAVDLVGELELLDGPGGVRAGPFPVTAQTTIGPERRGTVETVLDGALPDGPWRAVATLSSGGVERQAEAIIVFPEAGMGEAVPAGPLQDRGVLIPIALGLLLLTVIVLLVGWRQRQDRRDDQDGDGHGTPSPQLPPRETAGVG